MGPCSEHGVDTSPLFSKAPTFSWLRDPHSETSNPFVLEYLASHLTCSVYVF